MATNSTMGNISDTFYEDVVYYCPEVFDFETIGGALFILIFIFSVWGNALILYVLFARENLKNVTNLFILNLVFSDLIFAVTLPFWAVYQLHHWVFGDLACKLTTALYFVGQYSSVILLTAMTVDRFITVVMTNCPGSAATKRRCAVATCVAAWIISIGASASDAVKVQVHETQWNNLSYCVDPSEDTEARLGYYLQVSLLFFLPFVIIVFCYSAILKTVLQSSSRRKHRTMVVVVCIVAAFFICWGPYNVLLFIKSFYKPKGCSAEERFDIAYSICQILAFSHCCINPLLYMLSEKLRRPVMQILRCENARREKSERGSAQSSAVPQNVAFITQNSAVDLDISHR